MLLSLSAPAAAKAAGALLGYRLCSGYHLHLTPLQLEPFPISEPAEIAVRKTHQDRSTGKYLTTRYI